MFSVRWAAELRFRGRAEGAYCLGLEGGISRTEPQSAPQNATSHERYRGPRRAGQPRGRGTAIPDVPE